MSKRLGINIPRGPRLSDAKTDRAIRGHERALDEMVLTAPWSAPAVTRARAGQFPAMTGGALAVLRRLVASPSAWFPAAEDAAGVVRRP